ncbi:nucleotide pyrophosphohydrolase [Clostridium sp. LY3-2]|uniref:nucleotide pyrophosphohydrolase n=1 Tax=Clostridium sp. LY3-2 TaxID=2942482 RepID=UPI0021520FAF|nr:nucleotide pyrophosphohydrolase [Clostridium sp. LY3-2]MCR6516448.1 nucleotide pyrophosphohydrolase [Clostridium sp. LY3-2]
MERFEIISGRIDKFNKDRDWDQFHTPSNLAKSISIEANELLECFQWSDTEFDKQSVLEELADVTNYCIQMAQVMGVDLIDIVNEKMDKTEIKYPVDKAKGVSTKYNKL